MRTRALLLAIALFLLVLNPQFAAANSAPFTTVAFTYSGVDVNGFGAITSGVGFFTFRTGQKTITMTNLVSFFFFQKTFLFDGNITSRFYYGRSNLLDFAAVLTGSRFTSTLSLDTVAVPGTNSSFLPESFHINSLLLNHAYTANSFGNVLTLGTAKLVPEPTSMIFMVTGLLGIVGRLRKDLLARSSRN